MMMDLRKISVAQADGSAPTIVAAGGAPGESGVSVYSMRSTDGVHVDATSPRHLVWFTSETRLDCRIGRDTLRHDAPEGCMAICPAGVESGGHARGDIELVLIMIDPGALSLAAAEGAALDAELVTRLAGHDQTLLDIARTMAFESARGYRNGSLYWSDAASAFIDGLIARHVAGQTKPARGRLGKETLRRIRDYVIDNLDEPIDVAALATLAGRSPYHFSRMFARSVGMTPHRYVVHLRLRRAVELVRAGGLSLAQVAARTGFADQSHLSRWVRRVHGVSLTQIVI